MLPSLLEFSLLLVAELVSVPVELASVLVELVPAPEQPVSAADNAQAAARIMAISLFYMIFLPVKNRYNNRLNAVLSLLLAESTAVVYRHLVDDCERFNSYAF